MCCLARRHSTVCKSGPIGHTRGPANVGQGDSREYNYQSVVESACPKSERCCDDRRSVHSRSLREFNEDNSIQCHDGSSGGGHNGGGHYGGHYGGGEGCSGR